MANADKKAIIKSDLYRILGELGLISVGDYSIPYSKIVSLTETQAGDIMVYNGTSNIFIRPSFETDANILNCTPNGIVVVSYSDNVQISNDKKVTCISLKEMSADDPENGSTISKRIYNYNTAIYNIYISQHNYSNCYFPYNTEISSGATDTGGQRATKEGSIYFPFGTQPLTGLTIDGIQTGINAPPTGSTKYYLCKNKVYNDDNTINQNFFTKVLEKEGEGSVRNIFSIKGGNHIQNSLLEIQDTYNNERISTGWTATEGVTTWKTDTTLPATSKDILVLPCCAWRYCPIGFKQGDWYIPTIGQVAITIANYEQISRSFQFLVQNNVPCVDDFDAEAIANILRYNPIVFPSFYKAANGRITYNFNGMENKNNEVHEFAFTDIY